MTQDEIIEMAEKAGFITDGHWVYEFTTFAKLVAAHTLMNIDPSSFMSHQEGVEVGRLAEREACAELCMDLHTLTDGNHNFYHFASNQIRARGEA